MRNEKINLFRSGVIIFAVLLITGCSLRASGSGISCLGIIETGILAYSFEDENISEAFISKDGGITWKETAAEYTAEFCEPISRLQTTGQAGESIIFKFGEDSRIGTSIDAESTWQTDYLISPLTRTEEKLYGVVFGTAYTSPNNILRTVEDNDTGNLVMAAAVHGVIVRHPNGEYNEIGLGPYKRLTYSPQSILTAHADHILFIILTVLISAAVHILIFNEFFNSITAAVFLMALNLMYLLFMVYKGWAVWAGIILAMLFCLLILFRSRLREAIPLTPTLERRKISISAAVSLIVLMLPYIRIANNVQHSLDQGFYWYPILFIIIQLITGLWIVLKPKPRQKIRIRS